MSYEPQDYDQNYGPAGYGADDAARAKTSVPGTLLILVGIFNLLGALGSFLGAAGFASLTAEQYEQMIKQQPPENQKNLEQSGIGPEQLRNIYVYGFGIGGVVSLVISLVTIFGGIQMRSLHAYSLCVLAAILTALPCTSAGGCCLLGEIVGIWALIVLLNGEVRAAFR
jgi:hypothetical protein